MRRRVWMPALGGVVTFGYFYLGREYPLVLALLVGAAVMLLGWASVRTWDQLRALRRR